jgi:integrase
VAKLAPEMLKRGYKFNTINNTLKATRALVRWGAAQGAWSSDLLLPSLAMPPKVRPNVPPKAVRRGPVYPISTRAQTAAFTAALTETYAPYGLMARLTEECGARFGEVTALDVSDVDLVGTQVWISKAYAEVDRVLTLKAPKTDKGTRWAPIGDEGVLADLAAYIAEHPGGLLFHTRRGVPRPIRRGNFRSRYIEPARKVSGFPDRFTWHSLRHAAITRWIDDGNKLANVSTMAGHASIKFTLDHYYGSDSNAVIEAVELRRARRRITDDAVGDDG